MRPLTEHEEAVLRDALSMYLDVDSPDEAEQMAEWLDTARELRDGIENLRVLG